jgi:AhpD family alkylhydroperoxidase
MQPRIDYTIAAPGAYAALRALETYLHQSGLEARLLELVKTRVSQINGCAFCIDMHTQMARVAGETEQRLYALSAWHDTPFFSERERAALAWAEALTRVAEGSVPDDVYETARGHFGDKGLADLSLAIVAINGWNRMAIAFATPPGSYRRARSK